MAQESDRDVRRELGYYSSPTLRGDRLVFVSEDDLWTVNAWGGIARRLSSGLGRVSTPALSPDGKWLAFSSTEEGHTEVYLMPSDGGAAERLTYLGASTAVVGWASDTEILFASNHQQAFSRLTDIYALDIQQNRLRRIPCGPANHIAFSIKGCPVIARNGGGDPAYWKRYRGGRAGQIWIDRKGDGGFKKLLKVGGNTARPFWMSERIVFIADHEGIGNIYSVKDDGSDLQRHTSHRDFYVRGLTVDGKRAAYHAGGDLYLLDLAQGGEPRKVEIDYRSPRTQANRRFVPAPNYLEDYDLHPNGDKAVIGARGKTFTFDFWKGPVSQHGQEGVMRYRLGRFMRDGQRLVVVSDAGGEEALEIHDTQSRNKVERLSGLDLGRTLDMKLSPGDDEAALVNHRNELVLVHLGKKTAKVLDRSEYSRILGFNWSPDGRYLAYSRSEGQRQSAIRICDTRTGEIHRVTQPVLRDVRPFFDPGGEYLYFLSYRDFDPVYDNLHFDLGFPRGCRPYLLTLRKDVISPFSADHPSRSERGSSRGSEPGTRDEGDARSKKIKIDFDGIENRILPFPVADGRYGQLFAGKGKVYFTRLPIEGSLSADRYSDEPAARAQLESFDLKDEKVELLINGLTSFRLSQDGKLILYRNGNSLRVIKSSDRPKDGDFPRNGWLDLNRVQIPVQPRSEWRQMYREAWRLQRDHFWTEDMSRVDWEKVYERYLPLLDRVGTRSEVSDLIWEMQGELGTSHAYESGGDYRRDPHYGLGFLGVETEYDADAGAYRINRVLKGDPWDETASSPLARAGVGLNPGDLLLAIDGQPLGLDVQPHQCLIHKAGREVSVTFRRRGEDEGKSHTRSVRTLHSEQKLRYREWVEGNRSLVHEKSGGRIGYIHIPNMGPFGYAEFHRGFLQEVDREGLIVDVRFNGGGHVSQLLLEKLARRRIGYSKSRWFGVQPYPDEAPTGPMVALTNEYAGSDGDIFSHSFKLLKLGPLIGKRTWGGVIGISPSHSLVDGGYTTQPEYSFWFQDVGWKVENYGTDPDIEVEYPPSAYMKGLDPQLEKALKVCLERTKKGSASQPRFDEWPDLSLPGF